MTYNIRYDSKQDAAKGYGWKEQRRDKVVDLVSHYDPDLLGLQEAMLHQLEFIMEELPEYDYIGVGRTGEDSEYSAILYKKDRFKVLEHNTFWLAPSPEQKTKAWDAAYPRICSWGLFEDKKTKEKIYHLNTHFDHVGKEARYNSAKLIVETIKTLDNDIPVVLTGDFNATPEENTYDKLTDHLKDARNKAENPYGPPGTFGGFDVVDTEKIRRIDYIFIQDVKVDSFETITDHVGDKYPSDHLPVIAEINF